MWVNNYIYQSFIWNSHEDIDESAYLQAKNRYLLYKFFLAICETSEQLHNW